MLMSHERGGLVHGFYEQNCVRNSGWAYKKVVTLDWKIECFPMLETN